MVGICGDAERLGEDEEEGLAERLRLCERRLGVPIIVEAHLAIVIDSQIGSVPFHGVGIELRDVNGAVVGCDVLTGTSRIVVKVWDHQVVVLAVKLGKVDFARRWPDGAIERLILRPQPKRLL